MKRTVLLMNPARKAPNMRSTKSTKNPRRRRASAAKSPTRRRRTVRRRRNPPFSAMPMVIGLAGGAGLAAIAYVIDGSKSVTNNQKNIALGLAGAGGGLALAMVSPVLAAAVAGGGAALAGYGAIGQMMAAKPDEKKTEAPATTTTEDLGALTNQLGALTNQLGAVYEPAGHYLNMPMPEESGFGALVDYDTFPIR